MKALVVYESRSGHTEKVGKAIAERLTAAGHSVIAKRLADTVMTDIEPAELLVIGSWVDGMILFGVKPARPARQWLAALPSLQGKAAVAFCTYAVDPKSSLTQMTRALEDKRAKVVGTLGFGRRETAKEIDTGKIDDLIRGIAA
ncbi:MAG: flavodoxin family protein [Acidimicrobiales bacterium]